jgi:ATP-binding cassette, subfamily C, bacterial CydC
VTIARRLAGMLAPFRWRVGLTVLLGVAMIACNIGLLGMAAYLVSDAALRPLVVTLTLPIYIVRFAGVGRAAARYAERLSGHSLTFRLLARLRAQVFRRLVSLSPTQSQDHAGGDLLARLVSDVDELQHLYLRVVGPFLVVALVALLTSGLFALFSPALAWVALAMLAVGAILVPIVAQRLTREDAHYPVARAALQAVLVDGIQGMREIVAFGGERTYVERLARRDAAVAALERRTALAAGIARTMGDLVETAAMWVVLIVAIPLVGTQHIGGVYLAFVALVMLASFEAIQPLAPALQSLGRTLAAGRRVFDVLDTRPAVTDPRQPSSVPALSGTAEDEMAPALAFDGVTFAYAPGEDAIRDVTFGVPFPGRVAIVGPSGAGKSTLGRLAVRLNDPDTGAIRLAGVDLRRLALRDLRASITLVEQDAYLFNATLRGNLHFARPDASDEQLLRALEIAQLGDFVRNQPEGLDTWVGEQGLRLSGGERQRLAIARGLLAEAPILILDEPTANLDPATEAALLAALDDYARNRALVIITHRLVRMGRMDEILVLDGGRIVARGTHDQLLAAGGLYRRLYETQNDVFSLANADAGTSAAVQTA